MFYLIWNILWSANWRMPEISASFCIDWKFLAYDPKKEKRQWCKSNTAVYLNSHWKRELPTYTFPWRWWKCSGKRYFYLPGNAWAQHHFSLGFVVTTYVNTKKMITTLVERASVGPLYTSHLTWQLECLEIPIQVAYDLHLMKTETSSIWNSFWRFILDPATGVSELHYLNLKPEPLKQVWKGHL